MKDTHKSQSSYGQDIVKPDAHPNPTQVVKDEVDVRVRATHQSTGEYAVAVYSCIYESLSDIPSDYTDCGNDLQQESGQQEYWSGKAPCTNHSATGEVNYVAAWAVYSSGDVLPATSKKIKAVS